ncbi:PfkB family carbohydrate kinase [Clostridium uliginosum]|uniref:Ribokinase n=1 Tax=Clostridium uliginosum TaxID=119641 RepID=A0A1I1QTM1_9CLOT|nr:PfkB family carbohydrate kinase [Clostridium uliginosum]SFD25461.1 ribokinase [Clostridium uliginosum]
MKMLNFGSLNIDKVYSVSHLVKEGDTFLGFFISQLIKSQNVKHSLEIVSKAASITVSRNGASDSIPSLR